MDDAAFSLFAGALVYNQYPPALLDLGRERNRSSVSVTESVYVNAQSGQVAR